MKIGKTQDPPIKTQVITGFLGGLNTFQDETVIKDSELTEAKNILLNVDGIEPRPGSKNYGISSGTRVIGGIGFYKSDGTNEFLRFCSGENNKLQKYVGENPVDITVLGAELLTASNWTSTNWTGDWAAGWDHTTGNTTSLTNTLAAIINTNYLISYTVSGRTAGTFDIVFGGVTTSGLSTTGTVIIKATSTGTLSINPTTDFDGAIIFSIKTTIIYDSSARMNFIQARDKLYIFNGKDALSYYDGTTITTYTEISPPTGLAVAPQGTTGSTAYSYRVSAINSVGETLACSAVAIANGNQTLSSTNYNKLTWNTVSGAISYNVYGRKATGLTETYMATVSELVYNDTGDDIPSQSILPPTANATTGIKCTMGIFAISRIFASGDPNNPSRLYFGGTGDQTGNFAPSSLYGGAIDVFKNDGSIIRAILPFQGGVIIWKDNAIYKFSFNSVGQQQLEEITRSFGGISFRSCKHVENDIIFAARKDGRLAFYSLGNQENYTASVLRTNELSIKVQEKLMDVNTEYLEHSAGFYFNNIYGCAIPKAGSTINDRIWCLDTRFGAWTYWEGIKANFFTVYTSADGTQKLYCGSEDTGYMLEMFTTTRLDNSTAIDGVFGLKSFNQKLFNKYRKYFHPVFQFKDVNTSGAINGEIYLDGLILDSSFSVNQQSQGGAGFGQYLFGEPLFGEIGSSTQAQGLSSDVIVEVDLIKVARSIKYMFRFNTSSDIRFKFLSLANTYRVLENKPFPDIYKTYTD